MKRNKIHKLDREIKEYFAPNNDYCLGLASLCTIYQAFLIGDLFAVQLIDEFHLEQWVLLIGMVKLITLKILYKLNKNY